MAWILAAMAVAPAAQAVWLPVFTPSFVQLRPGETASIRASRVQFGISLGPHVFPVTFAAEDPEVAEVEGSLTEDVVTHVRIAGLRPGVTRIRVVESGNGPLIPTAAFIVVAEQVLPVSIAVDGAAQRGHPFALRAITPAPDAQFTWYLGAFNGGMYVSYEVGKGPELTITPQYTGNYEYWVLMTSSSGAGAAATVVKVTESPRRRAVR